MSGIKRDAADKWFSDCVRERADWTCESCGKYYPEGNRNGIECAHIFGRANKRLRWDPLNAFCLCTSCHFYYTSNPTIFTGFVIKQIGELGHDILIEKSQSFLKATKELKKEISAHYRQEFRKMAQERSNGVTGRIEFAGFD